MRIDEVILSKKINFFENTGVEPTGVALGPVETAAFKHYFSEEFNNGNYIDPPSNWDGLNIFTKVSEGIELLIPPDKIGAALSYNKMFKKEGKIS